MSNLETKKEGKRKMTGWIIALIIIAVMFGIGAIFCAPWSPINKALNEASNLTLNTWMI